MSIEYVTASHDEDVLNRHLKRSHIFRKGRSHLSVRFGFQNIARAYNTVAPLQGLVCYVHHDVYLPESFEPNLYKALDRVPDNWGVLGVAGVKLVDGKKQIHGHISDRGTEWGSPWNLPAEVDTLDEMLLITRGQLMFDEQFAQDFYGADLCMQARKMGQKCYAISAYCEHNSSRKPGGRTEEFYRSQEKFRNKWIKQLPIVTTCALVN